jgi:hypothetical protein
MLQSVDLAGAATTEEAIALYGRSTGARNTTRAPWQLPVFVLFQAIATLAEPCVTYFFLSLGSIAIKQLSLSSHITVLDPSFMPKYLGHNFVQALTSLPVAKVAVNTQRASPFGLVASVAIKTPWTSSIKKPPRQRVTVTLFPLFCGSDTSAKHARHPSTFPDSASLYTTVRTCSALTFSAAHIATSLLHSCLLTLASSPAGFVKPPVACARKFTMPLQDISVNRSRGWSLDTASSAEDHIVVSGSGRGLEPRRQPVNAPGSPGGRIQADEGFVRFLKTHSSPTHQRVTAGGRIVPMEPPSAPPHFKLLVDNSNHTRMAPNTRSIDAVSVQREQHLGSSGATTRNELKGSVRKPFTQIANFPLSQGQRLPAEPFPKFYDGQTGPQDVQKAATDNNKASLSRSVGTERNTGQLAPQVLGFGQNTVLPMTRRLERPLPASNAWQAIGMQSQQARLSIHGETSAGQACTYPQCPPKRRASQQQAPNASQHLPNTLSPLLDGVSTSMTPELGDNTRVNQFPLATEIGAYHGFDPGANQAVLYPSLFQMVPQGFQFPPFTGLPVYANQLDYVPAAYYAPDPYNQPASLPSALALQSFTDACVPLAAPPALNTGVSEAKIQLWLQKELALAEASFDRSTEQERMLDQYLAMHMDKMDLQTRRACTGKRMQIVEERAAAKDRMNQLRQALNAETARTMKMEPDCQSLASVRSTTQSRPANRLNVQAPSWVPSAGIVSNKAVKIQNPNAPITAAPITTLQSVPSSQANINGTKLTPLKPTRTISEDPFTTKPTTVISSPEKSPVDEWGARLGAAPPELERQQSEQSQLLESMASEASRASASPQGSIGNVSEVDGSWNAKGGRAPSQVEADHEQYLDAIRKDLGTTSVLTLSNGQIVKVEGQGYKQPKLKYMSNKFEKDYWLRKPDLDQRPGATYSHPLGRSFENIKCTPSPQKSKQTQEWVNGVVEVQKLVYSGRAPWITERMNLLSTKGEPSISLQNTHATSKTRGINGAAGHLRGRH